MGVLASRLGAASFLVALGGLASLAAACYSPSLEDCAVACSSAQDCGPGQSCRSDGWCAGPDHSEGCGMPPPGGDDGDDRDADASLQIVIEGMGQVEVESSSAGLSEVCVANSAAGATCTYAIPSGTWASLRQKEQGGWRFESWQWPGCGLGKPKTCLVLTGKGTNSATAKFMER